MTKQYDLSLMNRDPESERELRDHYARMPDGELQAVATDARDLTPEARALITEEMQRRSLAAPPTADQGWDEVTEQKWATVAKFRDLPDALLAKGAVESAGIECHLTDDNMVRLDWFISNLLGGAKLLVKPEDESTAREILSQPIPETIEADGIDYEQPRCPKCQSLDVNFQENDPIAYVTAYVKVPIPVHRKAWRCRACSAEWEEVADAPHGLDAISS